MSSNPLYSDDLPHGPADISDVASILMSPNSFDAHHGISGGTTHAAQEAGGVPSIRSDGGLSGTKSAVHFEDLTADLEDASGSPPPAFALLSVVHSRRAKLQSSVSEPNALPPCPAAGGGGAGGQATSASSSLGGGELEPSEAVAAADIEGPVASAEREVSVPLSDHSNFVLDTDADKEEGEQLLVPAEEDEGTAAIAIQASAAPRLCPSIWEPESHTAPLAVVPRRSTAPERQTDPAVKLSGSWLRQRSGSIWSKEERGSEAEAAEPSTPPSQAAAPETILPSRRDAVPVMLPCEEEGSDNEASDRYPEAIASQSAQGSFSIEALQQKSLVLLDSAIIHAEDEGSDMRASEPLAHGDGGSGLDGANGQQDSWLALQQSKFSELMLMMPQTLPQLPTPSFSAPAPRKPEADSGAPSRRSTISVAGAAPISSGMGDGGEAAASSRRGTIESTGGALAGIDEAMSPAPIRLTSSEPAPSTVGPSAAAGDKNATSMVGGGGIVAAMAARLERQLATDGSAAGSTSRLPLPDFAAAARKDAGKPSAKPVVAKGSPSRIPGAPRTAAPSDQRFSFSQKPR